MEAFVSKMLARQWRTWERNGGGVDDGLQMSRCGSSEQKRKLGRSQPGDGPVTTLRTFVALMRIGGNNYADMSAGRRSGELLRIWLNPAVGEAVVNGSYREGAGMSSLLWLLLLLSLLLLLLLEFCC